MKNERFYLKLKINGLFEFAGKGDKDTVLDLFHKAFEAYSNTYIAGKAKAEVTIPEAAKEQAESPKLNYKANSETKKAKPAGEPEPDEIPDEEKPQKRAIDYGKVGALHKAGWSAQKIADEMHCSANTVYNVVAKLRKEGRL